MNPFAAAAVLLGLCVLLAALALLLKRRDARVTRVSPASIAAGAPSFESSAGSGPSTHRDVSERVHTDHGRHTIVLYGSAFCGTCPSVRRMIERELGTLEQQHPGTTAWREVDLTTQPEIAKQHRITRTPTVIILDPNQHETARFAGAVPAATFRGELHAQLGVPA